MTLQQDDFQPFVILLINDLKKHTVDLLPHQIRSFYESVGTMLSDFGPAIQLSREEVLLKLMELQNNSWKNYMSQGAQSIEALLSPDTMTELSKILKINTKVCSAAGAIYLHQLSIIFHDSLNLYKFYSEQIITGINTNGPKVVKYSNYKAMRGIKGDILDLLTACLEVCDEGRQMSVLNGSNNADGTSGKVAPIPVNPHAAQSKEIFMANFIPGILNEILSDYRLSPPQGRDAKVLVFFATAVSVLRELITPEIPKVMDAVFEKTLEMITTNMLDYPEHRIQFFTFLREANKNCFYGLFNIPPPLQKLIIDSVIWAFKHTERNISETGLEILLELLQNVTNNGANIAQSFYSSFILMLIQDIFVVLTDRLHKSGFKLQASILKHIFLTIQQASSNNQNGPMIVIYPANSGYHDNLAYLHDYICNLLYTAFPNVTKSQIVQFVSGLFDFNMDINGFKQHLRDFLITVKEFASEDNTELYLEEQEARLALAKEEELQYMASVPGLIKQVDIDVDPDL